MSTPLDTSLQDTFAATLLANLPARIDTLPARIAAQTPGRIALIDDFRRLTYGELESAIAASAERLRAHGVRGGDRVMIVGENGIAYVVLLLAVASLDAWPLLSNARLSPTELSVIRDHARPRCTVYTIDASPDAAAHARADAAKVVWTELALGAIAASDVNPDSLAEPVQADPAAQCAALIYTTGTTGTPKGVRLSHRNLMFIAAVSSTLRRVGADDIAYGVLPISHVYGLTSVCLGTLYAGGTLRLAARFTPEAVLDSLAHDGLTILQGVPAMHARLMAYVAMQGASLVAPRLRFVYSGGSPLDAALKARAEAFYGLPIHNGYGLTECSPTVSQTLLDAPRDDCAVGPAIPGVTVRIVGHDGQDLSDGEVGELWVRGPNVMLGYYRAPELTAATVTADGWLRTGDLARRTADGALFLAGRAKEIIIHSGFNVYPLEVEQALASHPDVLQAAVLGRPEEGNEQIIAFVEARPSHTIDVASLAAWAAMRLAPYKRPAQIRVLDTLPAASTGKVLKHKLKALF
ncbi:class I adenylate-forming enzyme family protein [Pandoraea communis]|uniref:Long-chain fatty acid--CoA ligase n=1 Tax=Pandoraea communis TaxID=2508297 RepID=A0A5E4TV47_9BURK|nr:class I adenylate-forming enzyme family protein [Pandoraea communis]MDM8355184.1 class I adenylate-forming enzyme family protein [Pandoraea communis]VVD91461.1 long-chain fatty acid--CoA ligase [Pandoraea communis]